jgi:hypothetical protein
VVLYGCETWSLTLREEYTLRGEGRETPTLLGPLEIASLGHWTMDKVQKPSNSECHTPTSEPFSFHRLERDIVTEGCRKLHNQELHNVYPFPRIIRMMKSRSMQWAGHVALMERK